jgi:hypothetical protein
MHTEILCRAVVALQFTVMLSACSRPADNPYSKIQDAPLVRASLHTVTVTSPEPALVDALQKQGFSLASLASNYPASVRVEALLWQVDESTAAIPYLLMAAGGTGPNVRVLLVPDVEPAAPPAAPVDPAVEQAFFRNVLGSDVPRWPGGAALPEGARVQVWTYFVNDVVAARRRFREAGIAVTFDPVDITTAYLGDHRVMGIQAPDGTVIELVQNAAQ